MNSTFMDNNGMVEFKILLKPLVPGIGRSRLADSDFESHSAAVSDMSDLATMFGEIFGGDLDVIVVTHCGHQVQDAHFISTLHNSRCFFAIEGSNVLMTKLNKGDDYGSEAVDNAIIWLNANSSAANTTLPT